MLYNTVKHYTILILIERDIYMTRDPPLQNYGDVLLPKDIQTILHIGRSTVYRLLEEGSIKSIRVGKSYRIPKTYLEEFMFPDRKDKEG